MSAVEAATAVDLGGAAGDLGDVLAHRRERRDVELRGEGATTPREVGRRFGNERSQERHAARAMLAGLGSVPVAELVEIREGDALETLARDLPGTVDHLLLAGHKPLYSKILALVAPRLRAGSYVVADNADACPDYKAHIRASDSGYLSIPFGEDVELTLKL